MTEAARLVHPTSMIGGADSGSAGDRGFAYSGTELDAMASAPNYYRAIHSWFRPYLGRRLVEVGAGVGTFSALLAATPDVERLTLVEPAENNFPVLRERFAKDERVFATSSFLEDMAEGLRADSLALVNVLEHIEHDARFVAAARQVLAPDGHLLIFVPALPILFGALDEAFDHYRRYTRRTLASLLIGEGFDLREIRYVNLPGALSWFVVGRILRRGTLGAREVQAYDRWVVPSMLKLESLWSPPFGQSLLAIAKATEK